MRRVESAEASSDCGESADDSDGGDSDGGGADDDDDIHNGCPCSCH